MKGAHIVSRLNDSMPQEMEMHVAVKVVSAPVKWLATVLEAESSLQPADFHRSARQAMAQCDTSDKTQHGRDACAPASADTAPQLD